LSFVEKNKAWLLPLLGVGVAAVAYLNLRKPARPRPLPSAGAAEPARLAPAPPAAPVPAPSLVMAAPAAPAAPAPGSDLWSDLRALAAPSGPSLAEAALRERCREALDPVLESGFPASLPHPGPVREAPPERTQAAAAVPAAAAPARPLPDLGFILCAAGAPPCAWIGGRPWREGQSLPGGTWRVGPIRWNRVALLDPAGRTTFLYTANPRPAAGSRPIVEVP